MERSTNLVGQMIHNLCAGGQRWIVLLAYWRTRPYCTGLVVQYGQPLLLLPSSITA